MVKKGLAIIKVLLTGVFSFVFFLVILLFLQGDWKEAEGQNYLAGRPIPFYQTACNRLLVLVML